MTRRQYGLTLIELMVVIAIIAILATIAVPTWGNFVRRAARSEAITALQGLAVRQEQFRLANPTYADSLTADFEPDIPATTPNGKYTIEIIQDPAPSAASFVAIARAQGSQDVQAERDECGGSADFAINEDGPITDQAGTYANGRCWKR